MPERNPQDPLDMHDNRGNLKPEFVGKPDPMKAAQEKKIDQLEEELGQERNRLRTKNQVDAKQQTDHPEPKLPQSQQPSQQPFAAKLQTMNEQSLTPANAPENPPAPLTVTK